MDATQESLRDDEVIALLVPPRRPRWQIALVLLTVVAVVTGILVTAASGAVVPRVTVNTRQWTVTKDSLAVTFTIHNGGYFDMKVRGVDASAPGLEGMHAESLQAQTLEPGGNLEVRVRFDSYDCAQLSSSARSRGLRLHLTNTLGIRLTHSYHVSNLTWSVNDPGVDPVNGPGWAQSMTAERCHPETDQ